MKTTDLKTHSSYSAAHQGTAFYLHSQPGLLKITGPDRIGFLQRQTTNDLEKLEAGFSQVSVLVNPSARISDVFRIYSMGDELHVVTLPGFAATTAQFLKSHIFFMDKVAVENISHDFIQVNLEGPGAGSLLKHIGWSQVPEVNQVLAALYQKHLVVAIGHNGFVGLGFRLVIPVEVATSFLDIMKQHSAEALTTEEFDTLCVETGTPSAGRELNSNFTPLEAGLESAISTTKGCYTGQEVIARQITYDKITQTLVGLCLEAPIPPATKLWKDGKPAGTVTSYACSPLYNHIALAIVKRPFHQPGTLLSARSKSEEDDSVPALVVQLPFQDEG